MDWSYDENFRVVRWTDTKSIISPEYLSNHSELLKEIISKYPLYDIKHHKHEYFNELESLLLKSDIKKFNGKKKVSFNKKKYK